MKTAFSLLLATWIGAAWTTTVLLQPECLEPPVKHVAFMSIVLRPSFSVAILAIRLLSVTKYCTIITERESELLEGGQEWAQGTRKCLQEILVPELIEKDQGEGGLSCEELSDAAFASHNDCYLDNGFCNKLGFWDYFRVLIWFAPAFGQTKDPLNVPLTCFFEFIQSLFFWL